MGRAGSCGGYLFGGCCALEVYSGRDWTDRSWADAVECHILQGRDIRSVRVLVPDPRGLDQNFHDVTIVDMGDVLESSVYIPDLSSLSQQWPPAVISHMGWRQQELEGMQAAFPSESTE